VTDVLIVGGGLGGLCLAQGLRRSGVEAVVYERDASARFRAQGYRISLKEAGVRALRDCLPADLFALCEATAIRPATRMVFMDEQLRPKFDKPIPPSPGGFGVNRRTLREILLAGVDIRFGKTFQGYREMGARIRADFTDDYAEADLLVGADGTNSTVRRQLIPDAVIDELHWAVYGRTPITDELLDATPDVLVDTFNRVIAPDGAAVAIATCRTRQPVPEPLTHIPDYFQWMTTLAVPETEPAALHRTALKTVEGWHPAVRRILADADVPATFAVCVTSARPVHPWSAPAGAQTRRVHPLGAPAVTLLGDAVHTMSPGRGEGANVALRDAQVLRHAIVAGAKSRYEEEMLRYGFAAVEASLRQPFGPARFGREQ
jgi:2-polyprenyl-6-methoxyphenol hydroxylase-like FAD-dependent oxidoreductase